MEVGLKGGVQRGIRMPINLENLGAFESHGEEAIVPLLGARRKQQEKREIIAERAGRKEGL